MKKKVAAITDAMLRHKTQIKWSSFIWDSVDQPLTYDLTMSMQDFCIKFLTFIQPNSPFDFYSILSDMLHYPEHYKIFEINSVEIIKKIFPDHQPTLEFTTSNEPLNILKIALYHQLFLRDPKTAVTKFVDIENNFIIKIDPNDLSIKRIKSDNKNIFILTFKNKPLELSSIDNMLSTLQVLKEDITLGISENKNVLIKTNFSMNIPNQLFLTVSKTFLLI